MHGIIILPVFLTIFNSKDNACADKTETNCRDVSRLKFIEAFIAILCLVKNYRWKILTKNEISAPITRQVEMISCGRDQLARPAVGKELYNREWILKKYSESSTIEENNFYTPKNSSFYEDIKIHKLYY